MPRFRRTIARLLLALTAVATLAACEGSPEQSLTPVVQQATTSRTAAANALVALYNNDSVTFMDAKNHAHALIDENDPAATAFAGAVLDSGALVEDTLNTAAEFEMAWWTVGRLAFRAAEAELAAGRFDEAAALMRAGPERWRRESYWRQYPDHDALIAVVLANQGKHAEAVEWLEQRPTLMPPADEVYEKLTGRAY